MCLKIKNTADLSDYSSTRSTKHRILQFRSQLNNFIQAKLMSKSQFEGSTAKLCWIINKLAFCCNSVAGGCKVQGRLILLSYDLLNT